MSKPKDDWWRSAVWAVRNHPARKEEYDELHRQSLVADLSGMPSGHEVSRSAENIALRTMAPMKQREYDAVVRAIEVTKLMPNGDARLELIRRMYWQGKKLNMNAVIYQLGIAEATGKRWHGVFIRLVGEFLGYIN